MFLRKDDIVSQAGSKEIIFWGCSEDWVPKTKNFLPAVTRAVDINWRKLESQWLGLSVLRPEDVLSHVEDYFVVITTGSFDSVEEKLKEAGWVAGVDYCYSPVYYEFRESIKVARVSGEVLFSSSDYTAGEGYRASRWGGGIYRVRFSDGCVSSCERVYAGAVRQIVFQSGHIYGIDYLRGELFVLDKNYSVLDRIELRYRHYTGLAVEKNTAFLVSSALDCIEVYDIADGVNIDTIFYSDKGRYSGNSLHHLNDCFYFDEKLFFSYFSKSGLWRYENFDGGVSVYDCGDGSIQEVAGGLFQPHSPAIINGHLHFCESPKGYVWCSSWKKLAEFPGFVRGISFGSGKYFVGQSETLYMSRATEIPNVLMNSGIYCVDAESGGARFFSMEGVKNIHSVLYVKCFDEL